MQLIMIEDVVYKITKKQMIEIEQVGSKEDENLLAEFLEQNKPLYKAIGIISFSFRE